MLTLELDANLRFQLEPGYERQYSAAFLWKRSDTTMALPGTKTPVFSPFSSRAIWAPPQMDLIALKPLQLFPDFLDQPSQLTFDCVVRFSEFDFEPVDVSNGAIYEFNVGQPGNPYIGHAPATSAFPPPTKTVGGFVFPVHIKLQDIVDQSELGSSISFDSTPGLSQPAPYDIRDLGATKAQQPRNQGWLFRWWVPPTRLIVHPHVYIFYAAQYAFVCRGVHLDIYEDVSPGGTRHQWRLNWRSPIFGSSGNIEDWASNIGWTLGRVVLEELIGSGGSLMVLPLGRHKLLLMAHTGRTQVAYTRGIPQRTADDQEWDILRADTVGVAALTPTQGHFQIQRVKYIGNSEQQGAQLYLPNLFMDYTPLIPPKLVRHYDADAGSHLILDGPNFPKNYIFVDTPTDDACPPAVDLASGQNRKFGATLRFVPSPDLRVTPQLYSMELQSEPHFENNPVPPRVLADQFDPAGGAFLSHLEISMGSLPGEGTAVATVWDIADQSHNHELSSYRFRSEMPCIIVDTPDDPPGSVGTRIFSGYTEHIEVQPARGDSGSPVQYRFRLRDRWHLLNTTVLREQRDWQSFGHISVVDAILRQCGIDTGPLHADGSKTGVGDQFSGGSMAEYPAGWDDPTGLGPLLNTPLGTAIFTNDNLEANKKQGFKPQPGETGAMFIQRIIASYSNWVFGFRGDGRPYYLPYDYFRTPSLTFHQHQGWGVMSGLSLSLAGGFTLGVSAGTANIGGTVTVPDQTIDIPPNTLAGVYLTNEGSLLATTGQAPAQAVGLGTVQSDGVALKVIDETQASARQEMNDPVYRRNPPPEYRTLEPTGNFVQVISHTQTDQNVNRSAVFVDWATLFNPQVVNYIGRVKWFFVQVGGAYQCGQLNRMAYIAFTYARRRRVRCSFQATFVPSLKLGQIVTLEGIGEFRLIEFRASFTRRGWEIADYIGELVETGAGLPTVTLPGAMQPAEAQGAPEPPPELVEAMSGANGKAPRRRRARPAKEIPAAPAEPIVVKERAATRLANTEKSERR